MENFLAEMLNEICGFGLFNSIFETLTLNLFSTDLDVNKYADALKAVSNLHHNVIKPLAILLMFIYFIIALVDKLSSENFTWEQLWRQLAMLLVSKYLIEHGFDLLRLFSDVGMAIAADVQEKTSFFGSSDSGDLEEAKELLDTFRDNMNFDGIFGSWLGDIFMFIALLLPYVGSWIMKLCVSIICYTRVIEIYIRATFAPIALSDFYHSGLQGAGWKFLKSFLAVCLQGAMILVIAIIFSKLTSGLIGTGENVFTFCGIYLAFGASAVMLMFKSLSLTKEIIGVN